MQLKNKQKQLKNNWCFQTKCPRIKNMIPEDTLNENAKNELIKIKEIV